jgi:hemerythrin-like domain-containing protein
MKTQQRRFGDQFMAGLRADHADFTQILSLLSRELSGLGNTPRRSLPLLCEAFQFITLYFDDYHHPREDVLYEQLGLRSKRNAKLLVALRHEHRRGTLMSRRLLSEIHERLHTRPIDSFDSLAADVDRFVDQSRAHIEREERLMYSQATAALKDKDWRVIESAAPLASSQIPLKHSGRRYPLLARYLEAGRSRLVPSGSPVAWLHLDKAGETYGNFVGRIVQTVLMTRRQNQEAVQLAMRTMRAVCTPRMPSAYAEAVWSQCGRDVEMIKRWSQEWREL